MGSANHNSVDTKFNENRMRGQKNYNLSKFEERRKSKIPWADELCRFGDRGQL